MEKIKDLQYYKENAEENYLTTPISVLRYITELEHALQLHKTSVICSLCEGNGYTIEVQAECCGNIAENGMCCNCPDAVQVQKQCYCDGGNLPI